MKHTERGFAYQEFKDSNGTTCQIQKSSAIEDKIWLGAKEVGLAVLPQGGTGWENVDLDALYPNGYVANNRMHLDREQVKALLPILQKFVKTGELE